MTECLYDRATKGGDLTVSLRFGCRLARQFGAHFRASAQLPSQVWPMPGLNRKVRGVVSDALAKGAIAVASSLTELSKIRPVNKPSSPCPQRAYNSAPAKVAGMAAFARVCADRVENAIRLTASPVSSIPGAGSSHLCFVSDLSSRRSRSGYP